MPVYDACSVDTKFQWTVSIFKNLGQHFQLWEGEIPSTSFAMVGYGVQIFKANDKLPEDYHEVKSQPEDMWKITNYVHWVILFATPQGWMDSVHGWVEGNKTE